MSKIVFLGILLGALTPGYSQTPAAATSSTAATAVAPLNHRRLAPENAYARVYAIVPIIGAGTMADPRRPMFVPGPPTATTAMTAVDRTGIIAFQFQESDDGKFALAEFVTVARSGLAPILTSTNPNVIFFERGQHTRQEIETAFQKYKKNFTFDKFMPVRAQ